MALTLSKKKAALVKTYAELSKKLGRLPTRPQLLDAGVSRDAFRASFGDLAGLEEVARKVHPKCFDDIIDKSRFNDEVFTELEIEAKKHQRFLITTAVAGCAVHPFYEAIQTWKKATGGMVLILPSDNQLTELDPQLVENEHIVFDRLRLNSNLEVSNIRIQAKMIDPVTGLARFAQKRSMIFASPKQRMEPVAVSNKKLPHLLMTTGAVTKPKYKGAMYMQNRTDYIATEDHKIGARIVEVVDNEIYFSRFVQADTTGKFIDLGVMYAPDGVTKGIKAAAVTYGDWHSGETDPKAAAGGAALCELLKPKYLILHDAFDGRSISHHDKKKRVTQAKRSKSGQDSLEDELKVLTKDLNKLQLLCDELVMVKSNHDEFLDRWLEDGEYTQDKKNFVMAHRLAIAMEEGKDPLKYAVEELNKVNNPSKIRWLARDEDFRVAGIESGAHGDKGPNGSKGSIKTMEAAYGKSTTGHSHTPRILRDAWSVGTKSFLKQDYAIGPSSWLQTDIVTYSNGQRQEITYINGKFCL